jgi:hypothetical protein
VYNSVGKDLVGTVPAADNCALGTITALEARVLDERAHSESERSSSDEECSLCGRFLCHCWESEIDSHTDCYSDSDCFSNSDSHSDRSGLAASAVLGSKFSRNLTSLKGKQRFVKCPGPAIGKGTYGVVFMGKDTVSGDSVALKSVIQSHSNWIENGLLPTSLREISALKSIQHPNVVR